MGFLDGARNFIEKLGYFGDAEEDQDEEELEEEEPEEAAEEDDDDASDAFLGRILNPFTGRGRRRTVQAREADEEDMRPSPVREARPAVRDNVIRDERLTGRTQAQGSERHTEHVICVRQIEECREIIKCLLRGESVLLNLENVDPKDCGRIVDLLSGAAFALQGRMIKVAHLAYLLAPQSVEVIEEQNAQTGYQGRY